LSQRRCERPPLIALARARCEPAPRAVHSLPGASARPTVARPALGEVEHGVVMLRTEDGRRTLGRISASDETTLAHLRNMDRTPVGSLGEITMEDGVPQWRVR